MKKCPARIIYLALMVLFVFFNQENLEAEPLNRMDRWFVVGTNLAWFGNHYGTDLGPNHAEGWGTSFSREECETVFANLSRMGCPVVRVWAFERQEGLTFTPDLSSNPKYPYHEVTGLDSDFLANCDTLMEIAAKYRVKVYWSLMNHLIREEQQSRHMRIITDEKVRSSYISNACVPFVRRFAQHPALFAIDLINEVEGAIGGIDALTGCYDPRKGCTWKVMRVFLKECVDAVHQAAPGVKVTATSGWHDWKNLKAGRFRGLGLDFYDWHSYHDDPKLPHCRELGLDRACLIGEMGPKTEHSNDNFATQGATWRKYFAQARKGYAGVLSWSYGNPGQDTNFTMVNKDHSWRSGAFEMYRHTRGSLIPDAGPYLYAMGEKAELEAINALLNRVRNRRQNPDARDILPSLLRIIDPYFPYRNLRYSRLVLSRLAQSMDREAATPTGTAPTTRQRSSRLLAADLYRWGTASPFLKRNPDFRLLGRIAAADTTTPAIPAIPAFQGTTETGPSPIPRFSAPRRLSSPFGP